MSQESLNSKNPSENEELTEDELDAIAGGSIDLSNNNLQLPIDSTDNVVIEHCNMEASRVGATGSEHPSLRGQQSMNMSLTFP